MSGQYLVIGSESNSILEYNRLTTLTQWPALRNPRFAIPHQVGSSNVFNGNEATVCNNKRPGSQAEGVDPEKDVVLADVEKRVLVGFVPARFPEHHHTELKILLHIFWNVAIVHEKTPRRVARCGVVGSGLAGRRFLTLIVLLAVFLARIYHVIKG